MSDSLKERLIKVSMHLAEAWVARCNEQYITSQQCVNRAVECALFGKTAEGRGVAPQSLKWQKELIDNDN